MVRKGDWKLVFDMQGHGRLFNLWNDPAEVHDLYDRPELSKKRTELLEDLLAWALRMQDPLPLPRKRYVMKKPPRGYWTR
jgi:arylsulfatase A-like enzyme